MALEGLRRLNALWDAGEAAYREGRHRAAAELYRQATEVAESDEDVPRWFRGVMRRAYADELVTAERLREALAALAPMPKESAEGYEACCVYGNMTDHIEIAQRLPTSLRSIERAHARAEDYFRAAGERDWAGRLLYYKSELLAARGLYREALDAAREGFTMIRQGCPKLFPVTHACGLFRISLALGDAAGARRYLERWAQLYERDDKKSLCKEADEYLMRSRLARAEGQTAEALDHARRGLRRGDLIDWGETRYELNLEFVRAGLAAGRVVLARVTLGRLGALRRSENGHRRYEFRLLLGDYHLAAAREAAGLAPVDDELVGLFPALAVHTGPGPAAGRPAAPAAARAALGKARRAYLRALKVGAWIDSQLECTVRGDEVEGRLARAAEVERAAAQGAAGAAALSRVAG